MAIFLLRKLEHNGKSRWSPMGRRVWELMVFFIPWRFKVNNSEWGTLFQIFIFSPKIQLWFPMKIVDFLGVKNSWKCCGFGLFSCWQLWFHEKNCQIFLVKNSWKCWGFVKNEFLDKNLTFITVCHS